MNGRIVVLVVLCLPAWAIFNLLGPIQWLQAEPGVGLMVVGYLAFAAFGGIFISFVTTPLAVVVALFFVIRPRSLREAITCIVLALSAVLGTYCGWLWLGSGMRA